MSVVWAEDKFLLSRPSSARALSSTTPSAQYPHEDETTSAAWRNSVAEWWRSNFLPQAREALIELATALTLFALLVPWLIGAVVIVRAIVRHWP